MTDSNLTDNQIWGYNHQQLEGQGAGTEYSPVYHMSVLVDLISVLSDQAKSKIEDIAQRGDNISIADMFDMQMDMNHLSQMSEMSSSIVMSTNQSIMSIAKNIR